MVTIYRYIGCKSMGLVGYEIQGGDFVLKAHRQPPLEQLDAHTLDDHNEMEHDEPPPPLALTPHGHSHDVHIYYRPF